MSNQGQSLDFNEFREHEKDSNVSIKLRKEGNELFIKKEKTQDINAEILFLYTKSAAFAQNNSEELALAYGNRSALLLDFCKYNECLVDIERALKITKSDKLIDKLLARETKCLSLIKNKKADLVSEYYEVPKPTMKPSKTIPCASELVSLKFNEKYGRHVVAYQDIEPGTIIAIEKGVLFPDNSSIYLNCSHCLNFAYNGIPCESCASAIYCSEECKKEAWECYHDVECTIFPVLIHLICLNKNCKFILVCAFRILIQSVKMEGIDSIISQANYIDNNKDLDLKIFFDNQLFQSNTFKTFYSLTSRLFSNPNELKRDFQFTIDTVSSLLCSENPIFNKSKDVEVKNSIVRIIFKLLSILHNNSYSYQHLFKYNKMDNCTFKEGSQETTIGVGFIFASFCSFFNHSCNPNVNRSFSNGQIIFFSTNFIKKGQQLFVTYGPSVLMPTNDRKIELMKYNFDCDCDCCKENFMIHRPILMNFVLKSPEIRRKLSKYSETFDLVFTPQQMRPVTVKQLEDVKKIIKIFDKYSNDLENIKCLLYFIKFIDNYVNYFYGTRFDMPGI